MTIPSLSRASQALRATGLGASEVPVALGLSPFQSAAELAAVKRGELPPFAGNEYTRWGQRLERPIADEWIDRRREAGAEVAIFTPPTLRHRTSRVLLASADRVIVPVGRRAREAWLGVLEIKAVSAYRSREFGAEDDAIPEAYLTQVQAQLEVLDLDEGWLVPLIGGNQYREYPIARDREMGAQIVEFADRWWSDHVKQGLPCPSDGSEAYDRYLRRRYPASVGSALEATPERRALVEAVRRAKAALKEVERAEAEAVAALKAEIGDAEGIAGLATWRSNRPSERIDWEGVARAAGATREIIAQHTTTTPGARQLRLAKEST